MFEGFDTHLVSNNIASKEIIKCLKSGYGIFMQLDFGCTGSPLTYIKKMPNFDMHQKIAR